MQKITDIFKEKKRTFSFELFPPKTDQGYEKLLITIDDLARLGPDFISVTYGAGGGSRERTFDIAQHIQSQTGIPSIAHLTCVCHTKDSIKTILDDIRARGIRNILALRGDTPKDNPGWVPAENCFRFSCDLCAFIRENYGDHFSIGVAGFPEGHPLCPDRNLDAQYLKKKLESGADYVITQLFFDNSDYVTYCKRLKNLGVTARVIPGILPVTNYHKVIEFFANDGVNIPQQMKDIFEPIKDDKEKVLEEGIKYAVHQGHWLLHHGAPGLHFYCLNKTHPVDEILRQVRR